MTTYRLMPLFLFKLLLTVGSVTAQRVSLARRHCGTAVRTQLAMSLFVVLLTAPIVTAQSPLGSQWTYQGRLEQTGSPLNGFVDFEFRLYDAITIGNQVGPTRTRPNVQVVNGLFTVKVDFDVNVFQGDARWLDISVRSPHDPGNTVPYTQLSPRQELTATPYALQTRGLYADEVGNVGIGTNNPQNRLTVNGVTNFNGNVGIGNPVPLNPLSVAGNASIIGNLGVGQPFPERKVDVIGKMRVRPTPGDEFGGEITVLGQNGSINCTMQSFDGVPRQNQGTILVYDEFSFFRAGMTINSSGQGMIFAEVKSFRADNPSDPSTEIWYACIEGPEAAAYVRGTAVLVNGQATIPLPEHFAAIAVSDGMTVQLTSRSADSLGLAVIERSVDRIVVRELQRGNGTYEFDWRVEAVRKGFEDYKVIRPRLQFDVVDELSRDKEGTDVEYESEVGTNEHDGAAISNR